MRLWGVWFVHMLACLIFGRTGAQTQCHMQASVLYLSHTLILVSILNLFPLGEFLT